MGEVQFSMRIDQERRDELDEMSRKTGITATNICRNALYERLDSWKKGQEQQQ